MKVSRRAINESFSPIEVSITIESADEMVALSNLLRGVSSPGYVETAIAAADSDAVTQDSVAAGYNFVNMVLSQLR